MHAQSFSSFVATASLPPRGAGTLTRRRILDAARALLCTESYHSFGMEAVAHRAGLSRRTVYNQFADRDALYGASRMMLLGEVEQLLPPRDWHAAISLERFCDEAIEALASPAHRELFDSVKRDGRAVPWLADIYQVRIEAPLRCAAARVLLETIRQRRDKTAAGDPQAIAARSIALLRAAAGDTGMQPTLSAKEVAGILAARLDLPASGAHDAAPPVDTESASQAARSYQPSIRRPVIKRGAVTMTFDPTRVSWRDRAVPLSPLGAEIVALAARRGRVSWAELDMLLDECGASRSCRDVLICRIRRAFAVIGAANPFETIRGWGIRYLTECDDQGSDTLWIGASEPAGADPA